MARAKFQIPNDLSKPLSAASISIYKAHLNKIAAIGYDTTKLLLENQEKVVEFISNFVEERDDQKARAKRRVFLSAIFWVLEGYSLEQKKKYYDAFQKAKSLFVANS